MLIWTEKVIGNGIAEWTGVFQVLQNDDAKNIAVLRLSDESQKPFNFSHLKHNIRSIRLSEMLFSSLLNGLRNPESPMYGCTSEELLKEVIYPGHSG